MDVANAALPAHVTSVMSYIILLRWGTYDSVNLIGANENKMTERKLLSSPWGGHQPGVAASTFPSQRGFTLGAQPIAIPRPVGPGLFSTFHRVPLPAVEAWQRLLGCLEVCLWPPWHVPEMLPTSEPFWNRFSSSMQLPQLAGTSLHSFHGLLHDLMSLACQVRILQVHHCFGYLLHAAFIVIHIFDILMSSSSFLSLASSSTD